MYWMMSCLLSDWKRRVRTALAAHNRHQIQRCYFVHSSLYISAAISHAACQ